MVKKTIVWLVAGVVLFALNGCGDTEIYVDEGPELVTLFLVDEAGVGADHVPYTCVDAYDEIVADGMTTMDGEFTFAIGDRCTFDLYGFPDDIRMPLYIVDIDWFGKEDIPYECDNGVEFTNGTTDIDGWFAYPRDAYCKFYF